MLFKHLEISVDVEAKKRFLKLPKAGAVFYLDIAEESEKGIEKYKSIIKLKKN